MELQNISKLIELQGLTITGINCEDDEIIVKGEPIEYKQECPCCGSSKNIRNGKDGNRRMRHLAMAGKICVIVVPRIRSKNGTGSSEANFRNG